MDNVIRWILGNASLSMLILAVVLGVIGFVRRTKAGKGGVWEPFMFWLLLLFVGLVGLYTFVMHCFFSEIAASAIGWSTSPFQYEVGIANLMIGVLGIMATWSSRSFRWAVVLAAAVWLWGDGVGHIHQMIAAQDFSPGNAGSWFWTDALAPAVLIIVHTLNRRRG